MVTGDSTDSLIYNLRDNIFFWARGFFTTGKQFCCTSEGQPKNENNLLDREGMYWERMEGEKKLSLLLPRKLYMVLQCQLSRF